MSIVTYPEVLIKSMLDYHPETLNPLDSETLQVLLGENPTGRHFTFSVDRPEPAIERGKEAVFTYANGGGIKLRVPDAHSIDLDSNTGVVTVFGLDDCSIVPIAFATLAEGESVVLQ